MAVHLKVHQNERQQGASFAVFILLLKQILCQRTLCYGLILKFDDVKLRVFQQTINTGVMGSMEMLFPSIRRNVSRLGFKPTKERP